jgi:hypothetical protein
LGLRSMLANDPVFGAQPPAAVAIWDRLMAYGAAFGTARRAVQTLPFGAESERRAWSPVGNRWRLVRIRYPRRVPPGYGRPPGRVALVGVGVTAVGVLIAPAAVSVVDALVRSIGEVASDHTLSPVLRTLLGVVLAALVVSGVLLALYGAGLLLGGVGDLVRPRRDIEGRVLRLRPRGDDDHRSWHLAVDDGTSDELRAWRLPSAPAVLQGATVHARVSPWLGHVTDLTTVHEDRSSVLSPSPRAGDEVIPDVGAPPPMPDASVVAEALGAPVELASGATQYPLAIDGASATFLAQDGGRIVTSWIRPTELDLFRRESLTGTAPVPGIGDEAYRAPMGGGLVALADGHLLMVAAVLPEFSDEQRDRTVEAVARAMVADLRAR